jgi:hypothetical protein
VAKRPTRKLQTTLFLLSHTACRYVYKYSSCDMRNTSTHHVTCGIQGLIMWHAEYKDSSCLGEKGSDLERRKLLI